MERVSAKNDAEKRSGETLHDIIRSPERWEVEHRGDYAHDRSDLPLLVIPKAYVFTGESLSVIAIALAWFSEWAFELQLFPLQHDATLLGPPFLPITLYRLSHRFGRRAKPLGRSLRQIPAHELLPPATAQMHVGCFPAHRMKETAFVPFFREQCQLNFRAIGRQAAHYPVPLNVHKRIAAANGMIYDLFIETGGIPTAILCP